MTLNGSQSCSYNSNSLLALSRARTCRNGSPQSTEHYKRYVCVCGGGGGGGGGCRIRT